MLRRLAQEGITIVIIEHTMHAMVRLVDHFLVLDHGAVLVEGPPRVVAIAVAGSAIGATGAKTQLLRESIGAEPPWLRSGSRDRHDIVKHSS